MPVRVVYVLSHIEKALAFEWIVDRIDKNKVELHFVLLGEPLTAMAEFLQRSGVPTDVVALKGKGSAFRAWWKVFGILRRKKPQAVHTHLYFANLIGLSAAWILRIPRRVYTRHHGDIHHRYFPRTVWLDKVINALATDIVVLCRNLRTIVVDWEKANDKKIHLIPHGFDLDYLQSADAAKVDALREKYKIPNHKPVIGVVARYTEWKGIQYIIEAIPSVLKKFPEAHVVLCNAQGDYAHEIRLRLQSIDGHFTEIGFEPDLRALYGLFDVYAHTPVSEFAEAFGQTYVEALAAGVPSVVTLSGIACDFIVDQKHALVVPYRNSGAIAAAIQRLWSDPALQAQLRANGREAVAQFSLSAMIGKLELLYTFAGS